MKPDKNFIKDAPSVAQHELSEHEQAEYLIGTNPTEVERLRLQHEVIKDAMGGKLIAAPIDLSVAGLRILDSATADGCWLEDVYRTYSLGGRDPCTTLVGTDIVQAYFRKAHALPEGMSLRVQSVTQPWPETDRNAFDLVHQRMGLFATGDQLYTAIAGLVSLVKPGGWLQLVDADLTGPEAETDSPMAIPVRLIKTLVGKSADGSDAYAANLSRILGECGLVSVEQQVVDARLGALNPKAELVEKSTASFVYATEGMIAAARGVPAIASEFDLDNIVPEMKKGLEQEGSLFRYWVIWGQKPL